MRTIIAVASFFAVTAVSAQTLRPVPQTWTNSQGYEISGYTARAKGAGCEGSQKFKNARESGVSARRWASAIKQNGDILCTDGLWYRGSGEPGGKSEDVFIKANKLYFLH